MAEMWAKSIQLSLNCNLLRKRLNSFCKVLKCDFLLLISVCKRLRWHFLLVTEFWRFLLARRNLRKLEMIFLFWHLTKKLISSFDFLSLSSTFPNLRIAFKTSPLYLFRTIDEIDSFLGNRILAKNKKLKLLLPKTLSLFKLNKQPY